MDGGRQPPAIGVSFKRMRRMAIAGAGRREARRAECKERGGQRGLESQRRRRIENGAERDRKGTAGQAEENHPDRQCKPHAPPRTDHTRLPDGPQKTCPEGPHEPGRKNRARTAPDKPHKPPRTDLRSRPRTDRTNWPGRAAQGAKPHMLTPFQRETPPKWTKSEKFSLLLRENRQQTETRYGIQFQGD